MYGVYSMFNLLLKTMKSTLLKPIQELRERRFYLQAYGIPYLNIATKVMVEANTLEDFTMEPNLEGYAIKEPVFFIP